MIAPTGVRVVGEPSAAALDVLIVSLVRYAEKKKRSGTGAALSKTVRGTKRIKRL